jgi:predicted PurR-regulated permease PerM
LDVSLPVHTSGAFKVTEKKTPISELREEHAGQQTNWMTAAVFLITVAVLVLCGLMLYPFIPAITGAVVLATATRSIHVWWRAKIQNPTVAASSAIVVVTISIITPALWFGQFLVRQVITGAEMLRDGRVQRSFDAVQDRFPQIARSIENSSEFITLGGALQRLAGFLASHLVGLLSNSFAAISQIFIMLFLLFFLYRDEEAVMTFISRILPLTGSETTLLMKRLGDTLRATVLGRLVVATSQGVVAGAVFALLGIHPAVVLGLLTTVLGLIPSFGAYFVWLPVAMWLGATGHWGKMAILVCAGALIISTLDNFLYPALVGAHLRQHTASVFLSLLGGVWVFGIAGLVIGPLIFSATEALLSIWKSRLGYVPEPSSEAPKTKASNRSSIDFLAT